LPTEGEVLSSSTPLVHSPTTVITTTTDLPELTGEGLVFNETSKFTNRTDAVNLISNVDGEGY